MRTSAALTALALLLLAGCNAAPTAPETTVTPASVPGDPDDAPTRALAPGLTEAGVTDPLALSFAHDGVVGASSATASFERTRRYANGTLYSYEYRRVEANADRTAVHSVLVERGPGATYFPEGGRAAFWTDGERYLQRIERGDRTYFGGVPAGEYRRQPQTPLPLLPGGGRAYVLFDSVSVRVTGSTVEDGTRRYRLVSVGTADPSALAAVEGTRTVRQVSLTATVDERGVLRAYDLRYVVVRPNALLTVDVTGNFTAIGRTAVDRPSWYEAARNATEVEGRSLLTLPALGGDPERMAGDDRVPRLEGPRTVAVAEVTALPA